MKTSTSAKKQNILSKDDLIHQIAAKAELSLKETNQVIDAFTQVVREDVAKGHEVRLMGFGAWNLRNVAPRRVKSIRGGKQITLPAHKRVGFSVGAVLAQAAEGKPATSSASVSKAASLQTPARPSPKK
ncbi:MAG TPA: HU family DNA-binding protein [Ktedonosporobacter sp.]|nr:HU family DNA-binding protein [Ktedonosporobacter sp.]